MEIERITLSNCPHELKTSVDAISILVVDDDTTCLSIVAAILKKFKYEVVTVKHATDALCTLRIKGGAFDLIVSDVHMPDMNGFQLQQAIAQEFNLPVVLMSADDKEGVALKGLEGGAAFFIYKPVSPDDVRDLWQFAAMKRNKSQVVVEETAPTLPPENHNFNETTISVSSSSVNEDRMSNKRDSKRKSPKKMGSDGKKGETSQSATSKKPKVIWTNSLHNRFLEAIRSIGLDRAVPKKILEVMDVPGLTRENVASHLQKYRIFLRRVSDASYKIQYSADKGLSRNLIRPTLDTSPTSPSTLMLNKFPYKKPAGQFPYLPNQELASSGFGPLRLLSNKGTTAPKLNINNADLINQNNRPCVTLAQNNFPTRPLIQGHITNISLENLSKALPASFDHPLTVPSRINPYTSCDNNISSSYKKSTYQPNYVGYSISNIKHLGESGHNEEEYHDNSDIVPNADADNTNTNIVDDEQLCQHVGACDNSFVSNGTAGEQLFDIVIADYRFSHLPSDLPNLHCGVGGINDHEPAYGPIFDMSGLDALSAQQVHLGDGDFNTSLADQVSIQNQAQQNEGGTFTASNFYGGTSHWNKFLPSLDQAPNQQCSQGLVNFQDFGPSPQLNNTVLTPTTECDDDDFLESLLVQLGDDQTLEGI